MSQEAETKPSIIESSFVCKEYIRSIKDPHSGMYKYISTKDMKVVDTNGKMLFKLIPSKSYNEFYLNIIPTKSLCFEDKVTFFIRFKDGIDFSTEILNSKNCNSSVTFAMGGIFGKENIFKEFLNHNVDYIIIKDSKSEFLLKLKDEIADQMHSTYECLVTFE